MTDLEMKKLIRCIEIACSENDDYVDLTVNYGNYGEIVCAKIFNMLVEKMMMRFKKDIKDIGERSIVISIKIELEYSDIIEKAEKETREELRNGRKRN